MNVEPWHLVTFGVGLALSFIGGGWAVGTVLARQYDRLLTEREAARDKSSASRNTEINTRFDRIESSFTTETEKLQVSFDNETEALRRDREKLSDRIGQVEQAIAGAPTKGDITAIHRRVDEIAGELSELCGTTKGMSDVVNLIHRKLLGGNQ